MRNIPYTLVPLIIFNIVMLAAWQGIWTDPIFTLPLFSGEEWTMTVGDLMVVIGLLSLLGEVFRSATMARTAVTNHLISIIVLIIFVIEFVVAPGAGNSTFFILTIIALIDVLAGVVITIRLASRDFTVDDVHDPRIPH